MKLLLHACCGPCSLEPVRLLHAAGHDITIAYMNANIEPASEYQQRLQTLLEWARTQHIPVIEGTWENAAWHDHIAQAWQPDLQTNQPANRPSGATATEHMHPPQARCQACYRFRLEETARYAHEHHFDAISTTLTVSPYQYTDVIHEELLRAAKPYPHLAVVFEDFRPYYPEATKQSRALGMYRQNYCGCAWSLAEAKQERAVRKEQRKAKKAQERAAKLAMLTTNDFDYPLPEHAIAQEPAAVRDACKLLVMNRKTGALQDKVFSDIYDYLRPGDLLVANETRVMPARLLGTKHATGGAAEVFLLREVPGHNQTGQEHQAELTKQALHAQDVQATAYQPTQATAYQPTESPADQPTDRTPQRASAVWEVLVRPGKRLKPGAVVDFTNQTGAVVLSAEILDWPKEAHKGERLARLSTPLASLDDALHEVGHTPLPPYIKHYTGDEELYQTVFSREERSAAAPTAGLHFTPELIARLKEKGVGFETVDLEVGLDTFRIVSEENPRDHQIHTERYTVPEQTVRAIERTKQAGGRVIAVGTTSVRSLESAWDVATSRLVPRTRENTNLYILPGYEFKVVDGLITNFHVPRSTLMMLVSAFSSRDNIMAAYKHALKRHYRFLSFGDAMFII